MQSYKAVRRFIRYALDVRARLACSEEEISVRTLDISEGGVALVSPVEIADSESFLIRLEFPGVEGEFQAEIRLQSRNGFRYGFEFVNVSEDGLALLRRFQRRCGVPAKEGYAGTM